MGITSNLKYQKNRDSGFLSVPKLIIIWSIVSFLGSCSKEEENPCTFTEDPICFCQKNPDAGQCLSEIPACTYAEDPDCFCEENPTDQLCVPACTYEENVTCFCEENPDDVFCDFGEPLMVTPVERYGQLRVEGSKIVDEEGNPVQLQGMSFFWSQWIGKYYTSETVKWLKDDWRCTVVRGALAIEPDGFLDSPEIEKSKIKTIVDAAIEEGIYVIIDWHDHHAEDHLQESKAFFAEMAQLYGDYPNVIYELYNEPLDISWQDVLKPYHQAVIDTIRMYDPDNIIVCGTPNWSQDVDKAAADPLEDNNVAYTLHYYAATHKQYLRDRAVQALNKGIALMVTEYGTCEASGNGFLDEQESKRWWKFMNEHKISSCNWSLADKEETASALKPGASTTGGWPDTQITASGLLVRTYLRTRNPEP